MTLPRGYVEETRDEGDADSHCERAAKGDFSVPDTVAVGADTEVDEEERGNDCCVADEVAMVSLSSKGRVAAIIMSRQGTPEMSPNFIRSSSSVSPIKFRLQPVDCDLKSM